MSDVNALVARLRSGDAAALGEYWQLKRRELLAYIERRLGPALRAKLEPDPADPHFLVTVRGRGYKLTNGGSEDDSE